MFRIKQLSDGRAALTGCKRLLYTSPPPEEQEVGLVYFLVLVKFSKQMKETIPVLSLKQGSAQAAAAPQQHHVHHHPEEPAERQEGRPGAGYWACGSSCYSLGKCEARDKLGSCHCWTTPRCFFSLKQSWTSIFRGFLKAILWRWVPETDGHDP